MSYSPWVTKCEMRLSTHTLTFLNSFSICKTIRHIKLHLQHKVVDGLSPAYLSCFKYTYFAFCDKIMENQVPFCLPLSHSQLSNASSKLIFTPNLMHISLLFYHFQHPLSTLPSSLDMLGWLSRSVSKNTLSQGTFLLPFPPLSQSLFL